MEAGDDGQPHFHARKACDYLKSAVEVIFSDLKAVTLLLLKTKVLLRIAETCLLAPATLRQRFADRRMSR